MSKKLYTNKTTKNELQAIIDELQGKIMDLGDEVTELAHEKEQLMEEVNNLMSKNYTPKPVVNNIHSALAEKGWAQDNHDGTIWSKQYSDYRAQGDDQQQVRAYLKKQGKKFTTEMDGLRTKLVIHR